MAEKSPTGTADTANGRGVRGLLTARVLGVPAWMVGLGLGGAVLIWQRLRSGPVATDGDTAAAVETASGDPVAGDDAAASAGVTTPGSVIGGMWNPAPSLPYSPNDDVTTPTGRPAFDTNAQWRRAALEWALAEKNWSGLDVDGAISLWFDGREMTEQQAAMINTILREYGTPPDTLPSPLIIRTPSTGPAPIKKSTPGAPAGVRLGSVTATRINVGWDPPASTGGTPITGYGVQVENTAAPGRFSTYNATATGTAITVHPGQRYRIRVQARNAQGSGAFSAWSATVTTPAAAGAAPKPSTPVPADTVRTIRRGDVLWNMVQAVYGTASLGAVRQVAAHNGLQLVGSGSNAQPRPWNVGQTVKFPPKAQIRF